MTSDLQISPLLRGLVAGACVVVIVAGLKTAAPILNVVFMAWLLAYSITPLPNWLMRKRVPSRLAVLVTLLLVVVGGLSVAFLLGTSVAGLVQKLPTYQERLTDLQETATKLLSARGLDISTIKTLEIFSPNRLVGLAGSILGSIGNVLEDALLIIFLLAILLFEFAGRQKKPGIDLVDLTVMSRLQDVSRDVKKYVAITGGIGLLQSTACVIVLLILGVDFPIAWGVLFFFLNFIPTLGFLLALIPPAIVAFLGSGWGIALVVIIGYYVFHLVGEYILRPRFMKKGFDMSILTLMLSLIFWTWVLGPVGAVLAVPLTLAVTNLVAQYASEPGRAHRRMPKTDHPGV
jgi:AI-2 transport protein TqsA